MPLVKKLVVPASVIFFLAFGNLAQAFSVSPAKIVATIDRGTSQVVSVTVANSDKADILFSLGVVGVRQDEAGYPQFGKNLDEAEAWVEPAASTLVVPAKKEQTAHFTITVPSDAVPGVSHAVGLVIQPQAAGGGTVGLGSQIISLVTVQVAGRAHEALVITRWQATHTIVTHKHWPIGLAIENTGTVVMPVRGEVTVTNSRGKVMARTNLALGNPLLSQTVRKIWSMVDMSDTELWPGRYHLTIRLVFGNTQQTVTATTAIWYLPLWQFALLALCVGSVICRQIIKSLSKKSLS